MGEPKIGLAADLLEGVPATAAYMHRRRSPPRIPQLLPHRQRPDERVPPASSNSLFTCLKKPH
jgi:hypothetical protein